MICLSNSNAQTLAVGQSLIFNTEILHTGCAECYQPNSGTVNLAAKNAIYEIHFSANIGSTTEAEQAQLAININGSPMAETTMISTTAAAGDINNVSTSTLIKTCCCGANFITVTNTGTTTVNVESNPCLYVKRVA